MTTPTTFAATPAIPTAGQPSQSTTPRQEHPLADKLEFRPPSSEDDKAAGYRVYKRVTSPYERFMEEEGIPIYRGFGVHDTRQLELGPWKRLGGRGTYLYLDGLEAGKGMFVVEIP